MVELAWHRTYEDIHPVTARTRPALALALGILAAATIYLVCRSRGFFSDEGSYCTIAQGILSGKLPYRDYFNEKPPLQYFWTAAIMAISRNTIAGARLASTITLGLTFACILWAAAHHVRDPLKLLAWSVFVACIGMTMSVYTDTAESSLALLFCISGLLIGRGEQDKPDSRWVAVLHGAIYGLAMGFRLTAIIPAFAVVLLLPRSQPKLAFFSGVMAGSALLFGALALFGLAPGIVDATILFHAHNALVSQYFRAPGGDDIAGIALWILCLGWLASLDMDRGRRIWLIVWLIALACPFFGRMDTFRLWPSMAAALLLIAGQTHDARLLARVPAIIAGVLAVLALPGHYPRVSSKPLAISDAIAAMTEKDDRIWAGPFNPLVYCLAQREPATKYYFVLPWTAKPEVRTQIANDIGTSLPKLIVLDTSEASEFSLSQMAPELLDIISTKYHLDRSLEGAAFYARNANSAANDPAF